MDQTEITKPAKSKREILAPMVAAGMTHREIAKALGKGKSTVTDQIHRHFTKEELDAFASTEVNDLRAFRKSFLAAIGPDEIKQMLKVRGLSDYGIALDKERLILGQNDSNIKPMVSISIAGQVVGVQVSGTGLSTGGNSLPLDTPKAGK